MKTDWSQMNGKWVYSEDETPAVAGEYFVTLSRSLLETNMRHDGEFWVLNGLEDWPFKWFKPNYYGKTEPLFDCNNTPT